MNITDKIIRNSLEAQNKKDFKGEYVYEVGPGPGGLTRAILHADPERLTVIEMDSRCIEIMRDIQNVVGQQLQIIEGDAMQYDFAADKGKVKHIISNLPYNISVPLLLLWLKNMQDYASLTLMFQKEVAERITAAPNSKTYGRISVIAQLTCHIKTLFNLNPNCFVPAPKIWSTVLLFQPLSQIPAADVMAKVEKLTDKYKKDTHGLTVAVMGCVVNGPGEGKNADLGICGGKGEGLIIKKGEVIAKLPENELFTRFEEELDKLVSEE
jgi:16S rRNA (adenine1518-N6/adenine1519-N6)-dimethyltransferase